MTAEPFDPPQTPVEVAALRSMFELFGLLRAFGNEEAQLPLAVYGIEIACRLCLANPEVFGQIAHVYLDLQDAAPPYAPPGFDRIVALLPKLAERLVELRDERNEATQ